MALFSSGTHFRYSHVYLSDRARTLDALCCQHNDQLDDYVEKRGVPPRRNSSSSTLPRPPPAILKIKKSTSNGDKTTMPSVAVQREPAARNASSIKQLTMATVEAGDAREAAQVDEVEVELLPLSKQDHKR